MFYLNKLYYWVSSWLNYITGSPVMSPIVILITNCIFVIGGLFILNNKTYTQVLFYFDRLNNVFSIIKERFCVSEFEKLLKSFISFWFRRLVIIIILWGINFTFFGYCEGVIDVYNTALCESSELKKLFNNVNNFDNRVTKVLFFFYDGDNFTLLENKGLEKHNDSKTLEQLFDSMDDHVIEFIHIVAVVVIFCKAIEIYIKYFY